MFITETMTFSAIGSHVTKLLIVISCIIRQSFPSFLAVLPVTLMFFSSALFHFLERIGLVLTKSYDILTHNLEQEQYRICKCLHFCWLTAKLFSSKLCNVTISINFNYSQIDYYKPNLKYNGSQWNFNFNSQTNWININKSYTLFWKNNNEIEKWFYLILSSF